jgi:hypothetical protein
MSPLPDAMAGDDCIPPVQSAEARAVIPSGATIDAVEVGR